MCRYRVDADLRISFVDDNWRAFAQVNGAPHYADAAALYGVPLLSCISDPTTRQIYATLMERVRRDGVDVRVPFRCDAPAMRRWLELWMSPAADGGVVFASRTLREEPRPAVVPPPAGDGGRFIRMCSWCKQVEVDPGEWVELETAVSRLALFAAVDVPLITHGICPRCVKTFESGARVSIEPA